MLLGSTGTILKMWPFTVMVALVAPVSSLQYIQSRYNFILAVPLQDMFIITIMSIDGGQLVGGHCKTKELYLWEYM